MKGLLSSYSDEEFKNIVDLSDSFSDIKKRLGYKTTSGGVSSLIKKRVEKLNLDLSKFTRNKDKRILNLKRATFDITEILIENSNYTNRDRLKIRLVSEKILKYECEICKNNGTWNNERLSLQLDHKNGISNDNRINNIRFLCPNCHSQTINFSGKNKGSTVKMVD